MMPFVESVNATPEKDDRRLWSGCSATDALYGCTWSVSTCHVNLGETGFVLPAEVNWSLNVAAPADGENI